MCGNCGRGKSVMCAVCSREHSIWLPKNPDEKVVLFCSVEGCDERGISKGMCNKHYQRYIKYGCTDLPSRVESSDDEVADLLGVMREYLPDSMILNCVKQNVRDGGLR